MSAVRTVPGAARLLVALTFGVAALPATAERPFAIEAAEVLDLGACEWEAAGSRVTARDIERVSAWNMQFGCGLGAGQQVGVGLGQARSGGERSDSLALAGKAGLRDGGETAPSLTLAWGLGWSRADRSTAFDGGFMALVLSHRVAEDWTLHGNLGAVRDHAARKTRGAWAALLERRIAERIDLGVEAYGESGDKPWLGIGARWAFAEGWQIDPSAARQRGPSRARVLSLGLKLGF
jgi:hypothetical protein